MCKQNDVPPKLNLEVYLFQNFILFYVYFYQIELILLFQSTTQVGYTGFTMVERK